MAVIPQTRSNPYQRAHRQIASRTLQADAIAFARVAYAGHSGEFGEPSIEHPLRVMAALGSEDTRIVALLHDTLAHSVATFADVRVFLPNRLVMAVAAFAPPLEESEGIASHFILADPIALAVKLACIADLTDPRRLARLDPFTRRRREVAGAAAALALGTTLPNVLATWNQA
ncbi:MAG: hypothetical protein ABIX44_06620 [Cryobacterium sp.]